MTSPRRPASEPGLLGAILALALGMQLLLWSRAAPEQMRLGSLCLVALAALLWSRRENLQFTDPPIARTLGLALFAAFLLRCLANVDGFFAIVAPLWWGPAIAWLASGWRCSRQYWREFIVLAAMVAPAFIESMILDVAGIDITPITASFTAALLRLGGWSALGREFFVDLPGHSLAVAQGCSGLRTIAFLTGFAVIVLLFHPVRGKWRNALVLAAAIPIGFVVNAFRVALLAIVAAQPGAFRFWHIQQGAMFFEVVAIAVFLAFFYFVRPGVPPEKKGAP